MSHPFGSYALTKAAKLQQSSRLRGSNAALRAKNIQLQNDIDKLQTAIEKFGTAGEWTDIPLRRSALNLALSPAAAASKLETTLPELTQENADRRATNISLLETIQVLDARLVAAQRLSVKTTALPEANSKLQERNAELAAQRTMLATVTQAQGKQDSSDSRKSVLKKSANTRILSRYEEAMRKQRFNREKAKAQAERRKRNRGRSKSHSWLQNAARYEEERGRSAGNSG
ncbi:hypothetical protein C8R46DRAFT_1093015 [Mycena filopes]|nr:hypothetical protein C8R46DRAFT_1093015 [Mycena filopes]